MNRKGEETRLQLMDAAAALFAERGIDGVTMAELHEETGQRNKSAVQYHFGSRDGLVLAIVRRHQEAADLVRARMLAAADSSDLGALTRAFVYPAAANLHTESGRNYLRIVPHVASRHGLVDRLDGVGGLLAENLNLMGRQMGRLDRNVRRVRLGAAFDLLIDSMAGRASRINGDGLLLEEDVFLANLVAMIEGMVSAPAPAAEGSGLSVVAGVSA